MKPETHAELDRIASVICNDLCRWTRELTDGAALAEKCAACRPLVDMANLAERLEGQEPTHAHRCPASSGLRGGDHETRAKPM